MVDSDYVLGMFSDIFNEALRQFENFRERILQMCVNLIIEERARQVEILKELKKLEGISIRQIARTTGISQTKVWKA